MKYLIFVAAAAVALSGSVAPSVAQSGVGDAAQRDKMSTAGVRKPAGLQGGGTMGMRPQDMRRGKRHSRRAR